MGNFHTSIFVKFLFEHTNSVKFFTSFAISETFFFLLKIIDEFHSLIHSFQKRVHNFVLFLTRTDRVCLKHNLSCLFLLSRYRFLMAQILPADIHHTCLMVHIGILNICVHQI